MSKNLLELKKNLKTFAKRCKDFKYTDSALLTFLLCGTVFSINLFSAAQTQETSIENYKTSFLKSLNDTRQNVKKARKENNRLLNGTNLELIQLMEQGDHVIKSTWSSWQYGINYFYNNRSGVYKGFGDKAAKYPYEGIFARDVNEFNRYVSPESSLYEYLPKLTGFKNASTSSRTGIISEYGIASNKSVKEPIVTIELTAGIKPKTINRQPLNLQPKPVNTPEFPEVVRFSAINPNINIPNSPALPDAPAFQLFLGPDSNISNAPWNEAAFPSQLTKTSFSANSSGSMQNIRTQLRYTLNNLYTTQLGFPAKSERVAFKMWKDDGAVFGRYDVGSDSNGVVKAENDRGTDGNNYVSPFNGTPDDIYFNSYNFSYNGGTNEYQQDIKPSAATPDLNSQRFFVGGSRFIEIDNVGASRFEGGTLNVPNSVIIPANKTIHLGGPLTLGMVSQENGITFENKGKITDEGENQEQFVQDTPDTITLDVPLGTLTVKKSAEGYLGYKVGIAQVAENSTQALITPSGPAQPMINSGTIDFKGPNSIGMYVYLYRTFSTGSPISKGTHAQLSNRGIISLSGKESYGMKVAAYSSPTSKASMINEQNANIVLKVNGKDKADNSVGMAIMKDNTIQDPGGASFPFDKAINKGTISLSGVENSVGTYVNIASNIINDTTGKIKIDSEIAKVTSGNQVVNIGMRSDMDASTPAASTAKVDNRGTIELNGTYGIGMLTNGSKLVNSGSIITKANGDEKHGIGIVGINQSEIENRGIIQIKGSGDTENIGVFLSGSSTGSTGTLGSTTPLVEVTGNKSTGVLITDNSNHTMAGNITVSGDNVTGVVANDNSIVTLNGTGAITVDNNGNVSSPVNDKGSYGIIVNDANSKFIGTNANVNVKVTTDKSIGLYSKGELTVGNANVTATDGAINFLASEGGDIRINGGNSVTGQKSLLFYTSDNGTNKGTITFGGATAATIKGGDATGTRGTAFYYNSTGSSYGAFDATGIKNYFDNTFGTGVSGSSTLNHLTLNMEEGSRLFIASNVETNLSVANALTSSMSSIGTNTPTINPLGNYKTFMLYLSKLNIDQNVDLDNATDPFNQLEISNSSMENTKIMNGSKMKQVGMAQENANNDINKVVLENKSGAKIELSGDQSTGIYAKRGIIKNNGEINVGKSSTGIYLVEDNGSVGTQGAAITNESSGIIKIGENSTGIYYKSESTGTNTSSNGGIVNDGKIESSSNGVIAMTFDNSITGSNKVFKNSSSGIIDLQGDNSTGMYATGTGTYTAINDGGTIKVGNSSNSDNPNMGMFTDKSFITLENNGSIEGGDKTVGIYGYNVNLGIGSVTKTGTGGTGIYSKGGNININGGTITVGENDAVAVYYTGNGGSIVNNADIINIGDNSFGFVIKNDIQSSGNIFHSNTPNLNVGNNTVYIYSNDKLGQINNTTNLTSTGNENYGIYSDGTVNNYGNINFSSGIGNVGIYSSNGGTAINNAIISIGASDISPENVDDRKYSLGMAAGYKTFDTGNIINNGTINVNGNDSIGMYATGEGSTARNNAGAIINLGADGAIGMYLDEKAKGYNDGIIQTTPGTKPNVAIGVVVRKGATLYNTGTIHIVSDGGIAMFNARGGIIHNTGTIILGTTGNAENRERETGTPGAETTKEAGGIKINAPKGAAEATITVNGIPVTPESVTLTVGERDMLTSSLGMYIDTLKGTNPIRGLETVTDSADLIIGTEATKVSNSKYIKVSDEILKPYNDTIDQSEITNWNIYSGSLTWMATATLGGASGYINNLYLAKRNYTEFAGNYKTPVNKTDTYNFLDGLEQRYGVESLDSREKQLFLKLNSIGKNEEILFYQATDEMMGHQYGNLQQRINATGNILDKEFRYLKHDWRNPSKQNNKIKVFGMRDEYNTDTAGIIDYTSNAYGVAYVHEDEKIKMGNSNGWYAGAVTNRFKFKDIGKSKENQTLLKAGVFKTMSPKKDYNGALQWTIGGDVFVGINDMKRRYLVVDEVFQAKSDYHSYGAALKTDLGYDIRMSERTHFRPYGALKMEYGKFNNIKEDRGEMRLEVKGNDYFSVKPEVGMEFRYVQPLAVRTNLTVRLTAAYENELGKVRDVNNKGRVRYTTADWFGIRGEKEDRKGNGKFDLNIGVDNTRFGVTVNGGYDTKGKNVRGGIGFRAIY
ncbi:autotransporter-associated N-terminal domain-containing protein [Leptotrichia trevisanii]|uniref:autotransporter-associated N-terminal domain-containing protein n=1 Tax=Leptotrichia trevisanii TaxID=109328 RepID=UPI0026F1FE09|nr:autotransporter-associated N-terminal domain-containing protein [Leptotrichia trevisanii]